MKSLENKKILITGGTSRLGECFVRRAVLEGAQVFFTFHQSSALAEELINFGAKGYQLDLASTLAIDAFAKILKTDAGNLDSVIHNAAAVRDHTLQNLTEEDWDYVMTVNLKAPYYLTKKLLSLLFKKSAGPLRVILSEAKDLAGKISEQSPREILRQKPPQDDTQQNAKKIFMITSRAGIQGGFGISNYAAAKAGLIGLTKSMAQELGKKNILVNAVNPGFMKSRMTEALPETVLETHLAASPIHQHSDPSEVAGFLAYLCSDQMKGVTGQIFHFESRKI